ncbi:MULTISPECIES: hypothetical protein [unclassified Xanthobacter]|uniref:hypothetical protein n=1 Tax=unclassified Xanthobacter TaxID=2623496 RepID=UPI001EDD0D51|nr:MULTISPECIES: hypothetical protein [unclassified Xanthobacter]
MARDTGDTPIMPRFVPGTAVRIQAPWLKTGRAVERSRRGLRLVAQNPGPGKDETGPDKA